MQKYLSSRILSKQLGQVNANWQRTSVFKEHPEAGVCCFLSFYSRLDKAELVQATPRDTGWIEVVCGPMFSGKTEELIRRLRRAVYARQKVEIFKPKLDTRYADIEIVSHSKQRLTARPVQEASEILKLVEDAVEVVGIDEGQFLGPSLVNTCQRLANDGKRVIVAGLDQDFRGVPFEPMPNLLAIAEFVTKTLAICMVCGNPAGRSQRMIRESERVVLGAADSYEARCRKCHEVQEVPQEQPRLF